MNLNRVGALLITQFLQFHLVTERLQHSLGNGALMCYRAYVGSCSHVDSQVILTWWCVCFLIIKLVVISGQEL